MLEMTDLPNGCGTTPPETPSIFLARFDEFIADFGSRGPGEWDLNAKVWELHPDVALAAVDRMRNSPDSNSPVIRHDQSVVERNRLVDDIRSKLEGDATTLAGFDAAMRSAQLFLAGRERYKTSCIKMVHEIRMCFVELGNRMVERGLLDRAEQVFMLLSSELDEFRHQPERFTDLLRQREQDYEKLYELEPPFVVNGTVPPLSTWRRRGDRKITQSASGTVLRGAAGSGGVASGRARVILDASDPSALEFGEVLIAPNTDPAWTPLFIPAAAVVVNVGAAGSHSMIVCRELGIPCVVSVADATLLIPDGAEITVDGNTGTVTLH
jgi:phosphohistidine swiveling domain-containing protein